MFLKNVLKSHCDLLLSFLLINIVEEINIYYNITYLYMHLMAHYK